MIKVEIIPLERIADFQLGETRETIRKRFGIPNSFFNSNGIFTDYYFNDTLKVSYDKNLKIEYLEVSKPYTDQYQVKLWDIDVFGEVADKVVEKVNEKTGKSFSDKDAENLYSYIFPDFELSFWREYISEDIEEGDIEEIGKDGNYFDTVGIGINGYYSEQF